MASYECCGCVSMGIVPWTGFASMLTVASLEREWLGEAALPRLDTVNRHAETSAGSYPNARLC